MKSERARAYLVGISALAFVAAIPIVILVCTVRAVT